MVTPTLGNVHANSGFSMSFCFRAENPHETDDETERRTCETHNVAHSTLAAKYWLQINDIRLQYVDIVPCGWQDTRNSRRVQLSELRHMERTWKKTFSHSYAEILANQTQNVHTCTV